ncbi:20874_t:CDS:2, partial [Gigaspora margarita]
MSKWYDEDCKIRTYSLLANGKKEHIWVTYDEFTFHINDGPHAMWGPEKEQPLRKKRIGLSIHVSDFLIEMIRPLRNDLEEAHAMIVLGLRHDRFWDAKKLIIQSIGLFVFDNTTTHTAFAKDALLSSKMNLFLSGSVLKMWDTIWNGNRQSM